MNNMTSVAMDQVSHHSSCQVAALSRIDDSRRTDRATPGCVWTNHGHPECMAAQIPAFSLLDYILGSLCWRRVRDGTIA